MTLEYVQSETLPLPALPPPSGPSYARGVVGQALAGVLAFSAAPTMAMAMAHELTRFSLERVNAARMRSALARTDEFTLATQAPTFEDQYARLGRTKGPEATPQSRRALRAWWIEQGHGAAQWLVKKIGGETHWDTLHAVIDVLLAHGPEGATIARQALARGDCLVDARIALLKVLRDGPLDAATRDEVRALAERAAEDPDVDVREVADELSARIATEPVSAQHG